MYETHTCLWLPSQGAGLIRVPPAHSRQTEQQIRWARRWQCELRFELLRGWDSIGSDTQTLVRKSGRQRKARANGKATYAHHAQRSRTVIGIQVVVLLFNTAVPNTKLSAWREEDSGLGGHVLWDTTSLCVFITVYYKACI